MTCLKYFNLHNAHTVSVKITFLKYLNLHNTHFVSAAKTGKKWHIRLRSVDIVNSRNVDIVNESAIYNNDIVIVISST